MPTIEIIREGKGADFVGPRSPGSASIRISSARVGPRQYAEPEMVVRGQHIRIEESKRVLVEARLRIGADVAALLAAKDPILPG